MPVPMNNTFRRMTINEESSMQISAIYLNNQTHLTHADEVTLQTESTHDSMPPDIDLALFEDIANLMEKAKLYQDEEKEFIRKTEKYNRNIKVAEDMIEKAQSKKDALLKRNEFLKGCLEDKELSRKKALKYWEDFGIDVQQVSTTQNDFQEYAFLYSRLPCRETIPNESTLGNQLNDEAENEQDGTRNCVVNLRKSSGRLEITEQMPDILSPDDLREINNRLTNNCINSADGRTDYKLAMLLIRKHLIKNLASLSKTSLRQPVGTNSHTCT